MASRRGPLPLKAGFNQLSCPRHPDANLVEDYHAGDMICPECGLVVGDRVIDVGSEWRTFSKDSGSADRSRVGGPENPLMGGSDLSTAIDSKTLVHSTGNKENTQSFSKWQETGGASGNRALISAFSEIETMASRIHLPKNIVDKAKELFKQTYEEKSLRGRANNAVASACLYIACRQEGVPRSFKEICAISNYPKKEIGTCYKLVQKILGTEMEEVQSKDFMSRFCTQLSLSATVQKAATHISQKAQDLDLVPGRVYLSVAAAAIYMASRASDTKKTHKEVGTIVGVSESTIRQTYRLLYKDRDKLFPEDFPFTTPLDDLPKH